MLVVCELYFLLSGQVSSSMPETGVCHSGGLNALQWAGSVS